MNELNDIVEVNISRGTVSVSIASFDIPAIIAEFDASKTTPTFGRSKLYGSLPEMLSDGFTTSDQAYISASKILAQQPSVQEFIIGRKDSTDADWTTALSLIQADYGDWYSFSIIPSQVDTIVFDADFVTLNEIDMVVGGVTIPTVTFDTDQATTMTAIKTAVELANPLATVTLLDTGALNQDLSIELSFGNPATSIEVTLGASQPSIVESTVIDEAEIKEAMLWVEAQTKMYFFSSKSTDITNPATTTDLLSYAQSNTLDRTVGTFYKNDANSFIESAVQGRFLPIAPGGSSWTYKPLSSIQSYALDTAEKNAIEGKNGNIYINRSSVNGWEQGIVSSGENIFAIRGVDYLEARLQQALFGLMSALDKVPFDDVGIQMVGGIVSGVLAESERAGILVAGSSTVFLPLFSDIPAIDKQAGVLAGITFNALLQGAIKKVKPLNGTVSY